MTVRRALVRVLGRTRQLPGGDVLGGVFPAWVPVYNSAGATFRVFRRDGVSQGVAGYIPAYTDVNGLLRVDTDASFNGQATQSNGTVLALLAAVRGTAANDTVQFANLAAFPAVGAADKTYVALDTGREYSWGGNAYIWIGAPGATAAAGTTDTLPEGTNNLYFTAARVLSTLLTGFATGANAAVAATDSILQAFAKVQAQLDNKLGLTGTAAAATKLATARTINGTPFDGTANITISGGVFTAAYDSGPQVITVAGLLTLPHGLGGVPKLLQMRLISQTGELGWPAGTELDMAAVQYTGASSQMAGSIIAADATNVYIQFANRATTTFSLPLNAGGGGAGGTGNTTNSVWRVRALAWI